MKTRGHPENLCLSEFYFAPQKFETLHNIALVQKMNLLSSGQQKTMLGLALSGTEARMCRCNTRCSNCRTPGDLTALQLPEDNRFNHTTVESL